MIVYAFRYNSCIYESSWATISLHYTKAGAYKALRAHRRMAFEEWKRVYADEDLCDELNDIRNFWSMLDWYVAEVEVLE